MRILARFAMVAVVGLLLASTARAEDWPPGKRCQEPFDGTARRVLRTNGSWHRFPGSRRSWGSSRAGPRADRHAAQAPALREQIWKVTGVGGGFASPSIAGGRLYLRYGDNLCAHDIKAGR